MVRFSLKGSKFHNSKSVSQYSMSLSKVSIELIGQLKTDMKIMCEYQRQISVSVVAQLILHEYCIVRSKDVLFTS